MWDYPNLAPFPNVNSREKSQQDLLSGAWIMKLVPAKRFEQSKPNPVIMKVAMKVISENFELLKRLAEK